MLNSELFEGVDGFESRLPAEGCMCLTKKKKKKLLGCRQGTLKCTFYILFIQNLDNYAQFSNFWLIGHTKILAVHP
jgi:hypothetical protein